MSSIRIGGIQVSAVADGAGLECGREVLSKTDRSDGWSEHEDELDANGDVHLALGGYLIRTGDRVVLVDVGVGTIDNGRYRGGLFLEGLRAHGLEPEDVTDVAFTHLHFDHVGWATQKGQVIFNRATHHVHEAEWNHFVEDLNAPPGGVRKLAPLAEHLSTFSDISAIAPGVTARPAIGHTPGSTVYIVSAEGDTMVLLGDLAHSRFELTEPGWTFVHDVDPEQAVASRREIVEEFKDTDALIAGGHFPDLAPGRLVSQGDALNWITN
ncbi:MAG: beta-lactamase domain protein [Aeromicrobium sp.]|jgi:glyoxylase-like metal-dependent hydrolase (beta-lactamase superfamily II)|nr:beta-lactamase domain protein [Aeromicrobium sp.]